MTRNSNVTAIDERKALREEVLERSVTPRELLKQLKTGQPLDVPKLSVERNYWMVACLLALVVALVSLWGYISANSKMQNNKELIYVRVKENGTWDINFAESTRATEFLPATVDSIIHQWVTRRFQEVPHTVRYDYGFVQLFMSPQLSKAFVDPAQGNAVAHAAEIKDRIKGGEKHIEIRTIDHTSGEKTEFGKVQGQLYRSTVFIREVIKDERGTIQGTPKLKIVPIHWRLMSKKEIEAAVQQDGGVLWLRNNPIGLQIIEYSILDDPSSNTTNANGKD